MTGDELSHALGLHPRATYDFLDMLVALHVLERDGDGPDGRYRNTAESAAFLDTRSPAYIGGVLEICNARLYRFWGDLTEALQTGKPQNEIKHTGNPMFEELYARPRPARAVHARHAGLLARQLPRPRGDIRLLAIRDIVRRRRRHRTALHDPRHPTPAPALHHVRPARRRSRSPNGRSTAAGVADRVTVASGDFFVDPLPSADIITMGMVLHDWNHDQKLRLIRSAYDALPDGGVFIVIENMIDDARRENAFALMMSLNMLIEFGDAFDFTGAATHDLVQRRRLPGRQDRSPRGPRKRRHRAQVTASRLVSRSSG